MNRRLKFSRVGNWNHFQVSFEKDPGNCDYHFLKLNYCNNVKSRIHKIVSQIKIKTTLKLVISILIERLFQVFQRVSQTYKLIREAKSKTSNLLSRFKIKKKISDEISQNNSSTIRFEFVETFERHETLRVTRSHCGDNRISRAILQTQSSQNYRCSHIVEYIFSRIVAPILDRSCDVWPRSNVCPMSPVIVTGIAIRVHCH